MLLLPPDVARRAAQRKRPAASTSRLLLLLALLLALAAPGRAQAPAWTAAVNFLQPSLNGTAVVRATALNSAGDVLVVGTFTGQVGFGATLLASAGGNDVFLAKYGVATNTWTWAVAAGGTNSDTGQSLAVSGTSVYVTGGITANNANAQAVRFGSVALAGRGNSASADLFVASFTDAGGSATCNWAVAAGGTGADQGNAVAVNGSNVYVAGAVTNNGAGSAGVKFGGVTLAGASLNNSPTVAVSTDLFVARYTSAPASATYNWALAGGGTGADQAHGLALSGTAVYVTGSYTNNNTDSTFVRVGGAFFNGANSALSADLLLVRYTDATASATFNWAARGGGRGADAGLAVAVSGTSVYVAGSATNNDADDADVQFGSKTVVGTSGSTTADALALRYEVTSSTATCSWAVAGGGTGADAANALAVSSAGVRLGLGLGTGPATCGTLRTLPPNAAGVATLTSAGAWQSAVATRTASGTLSPEGVATNATGEVLVAGSLSGQVLVGDQLYVSMGSSDAFVGKYSPATGTWAWLLTGGGAGNESAVRLAVSGSNVYVAGSYADSGLSPARFGSQKLYGAGRSDALVAKCVDAGSSASWAWAAGGGGTTDEWGNDVAVSGTSVYLTGNFYNNSANANDVYFSPHRLPGVGGVGANAFVAKYTDGSTSVTCNWVTAAGSLSGGLYSCYAEGIAAVGNSVYITGDFTNSTTDSGNMRFGGVAVPGATPSNSTDAFLVKYTDAGTRANFAWGRAIGGTRSELRHGAGRQRYLPLSDGQRVQ